VLLVERVLPLVPYRQWTLSSLHRVRWVLMKPGLCRDDGGAEEGAHATPGLGRLLRRTFALDVFTCVRYGSERRVLASPTEPDGGAPFCSTWGCPLGLRSGPLHRGHRSPYGAEH
jgi:hypothetical protein